MANGYDNNGEVRSEGFGTRELVVRGGETAAMAVAEQAKAAIQARYVMALQRPRDMMTVRDRLLRECKRPGFAQVAKYSVPRAGKRVIGPSIRYAEAAIRCMTNVLPEQMVVFDDDDKRIVRVSVTDLEANVCYTQDIVLSKTVERTFVKDGQEVLSMRENSEGRNTYTVRATEDDLRNKEAANVSKAIRGMALRLLPGDILDECMALIDETLKKDASADPQAAIKKIVDAFSAINVSPSALVEFLGCPVEQASPGDITELRGIYQAIRDGETNWRDVIGNKVVNAPATDTPKPANNAKDKLRQQAATATQQAQQSMPKSDTNGNL